MIYLDRESCRIKSYSATTRGAKSILKIEIEVGDPMELGFMLRELAEEQGRQKTPKPDKPSASTLEPPMALLALPGPAKGRR